MEKYLARYSLNVYILHKEENSLQSVHSEFEFEAKDIPQAKAIAEKYLPYAESEAYKKGKRIFDYVFERKGKAILERLLKIEEIPLAQTSPKCIPPFRIIDARS